jgi:uncharacterized protein with von Willebrand factor type A (vWA) domain
MQGVLIEDYRNPVYRTLARDVLGNFLLKNKKIAFPAILDSAIVHYKHWPTIVVNPKAKSAWKRIVEKYIGSDEFKALNEAVHGDPLLAKYATIRFLNRFTEQYEKFKKEIRESHEEKQGQKEEPIFADASNLSSEAKRAVNFMISALIAEAKETLEDIRIAKSFSHIGIPMLSFLEEPDRFRDTMRNRIVVNFLKILKRVQEEAPSTRQARMPTLAGGRPLGVKRLQRWSELTRVVPQDLADEALLDYRIASRTVRVSEQYGGTKNYAIYLDKSGSMAGSIPYRHGGSTEHVPKISFAAAAAMAVAAKQEKIGAKTTLKFFDTEVHEPVKNPAEIIRVLLRIQADGGTSISKVLEDAAKNHRDERIIVITDGIDEVSEEAVRAAKGLDLSCVFIDTDNELLRKNFHCVHLREARPDVVISL